MKTTWQGKHLKEWGYQILVLIVLFLVYAYNRHEPDIDISKVVFFLFYASVAMFINYFALPKYFYKKQYKAFSLIVVICLVVLYLMEEFVLEHIFFPDSRAKYVSNVFYTLLDIVPLVVTMVSFKFTWDAVQKHQKIEELQSSVQESELRFLKSQINPHFLFNNLNNLYSYAIENSPKTPSIILELSSVLRYILYDCKEDFVPLSKEIEHLKDFTALNELHIEDRGQVSFTANTPTNHYMIAPLILSMFVENAFKHSTASQSDDILIDIDLHISETGILNFKCKNSFLPNANHQSLSQGIGLANVKKRLELLYPDAYELEISDINNLYEVTLTLQLQSKNGYA